MAVGKVWLVGAGPGDPGLITVRGLEALRSADAVLYDALAHPALLDECPQADKRNVGKCYGGASATQEAICAQLIELARSGKTVVRLKGGDPLLFARGAEEAEVLRAAEIPFEIVPGVPSPTAAAAYAGISLTHRELSSSTTFITGSDRAGKEWSPEAWKKLATATDTICVLMGMRRIEEITQAIIDGGRAASTPAAVIQWGTRPEQRVLVATLGDIAARARAEGLSNPAIIVVGEVVRLRETLRWFDNRPLFGKRILIPRPPHQAGATAEAIRERSAEPIAFPVIEIMDPPDPQPLRDAIARLADYAWVLFTSANGVDRFFAALHDAGRDARALGNARVGVIGPKTGHALSKYGVRPDSVAKEFVGESLAQELLAASGRGKVLVPRALSARETMPQMLRDAGFEVDVVPAYETKPVSERGAELAALLTAGAVDVILFTSGSTVASTCELLGDDAAELLSRVVIASIGPITSDAARARGLSPTVTAQVFTVDGLLDALEAHYSGAN
ncbi:MAG: uroporphyrinogen-III C-methyltransferase [Polyangiaceae bacterium]